MIQKTVTLGTFYEALRPELERKSDLCSGCRYKLEILPKFGAGQTATADNEKLVQILEKAEVLCKDCQSDLLQYQRGVFSTLGQVEIEEIRHQMEEANTEAELIRQEWAS